MVDFNYQTPSTREFFLDFWTRAINPIVPIWDGWMEDFQAHSNCVSSSSQAKTSTQPRSFKKTTKKLFWERKSVPKSHKDRQVGGDDQQKGTSSLGKEEDEFFCRRVRNGVFFGETSEKMSEKSIL